MSEDQRGIPTCGKGLAENSVVPAAIGRVLSSLTRVLTTHIPTIDMSDAAGSRERQAYSRLSNEYGRLADELSATAADMAACRDLPAARHHEEALGDPVLLDAFEEYVVAEESLLGLLRDSAERDRAMLNAFRSAP